MSDLQAMARGAMLMANLNPPSRVIYPPGAVLDDSLFVSSGQMSSGYLFTTSDLTELLAKGAIVPV